MNDEEEKKTKNGPLSFLLIIVVGIFLAGVFLSFFVLWANEGWSSATKKNPVGGALFYIVLGVVYLLAIPMLRDKGYNAASAGLLWIAVAVGSIAALSALPSCGSSNEFPADRPYRK